MRPTEQVQVSASVSASHILRRDLSLSLELVVSGRLTGEPLGSACLDPRSSGVPGI